MNGPSPALVTLLFAVVAWSPAQAQGAAERVETWPDGKIKLRYSVDEQGNRHGQLEEFAPNGTRVQLAFFAHGQLDGGFRQWSDAGKLLRSCAYRKGVLHGQSEEHRDDGSSTGEFREGLRHGRWLDVDSTGQRRRTAEYRAGRQHGAVRIQHKDKVLTRQLWKDGELVQLDDLQPFPVGRDRLLAELRAILQQPPLVDAADTQIGARSEALRRLQAYRHLCGLPWQQMSLVPEWNQRCDAAAEVCRRLGRLDHDPPRPPGVDDARYELGRDGARHSNLAIGGPLWRSVDSYMDDSDPTNIDRVGHRRWCLNPAMLRTGFGSDQQFHAMWSMDGSGRGVKGMTAVYYPPRGFVPVDLFGTRRAFSIALLRGGAPKKDELRAEVQPLDGDYLPVGEPLALDWCAVAGDGFGGSPCVVFRPDGLVVEPGRRYLVSVSLDAGKTQAHRYLVEFCAAVAEGPESLPGR